MRSMKVVELLYQGKMILVALAENAVLNQTEEEDGWKRITVELDEEVQ